MPRVFMQVRPDGWVALIIQHVALFIGMAITIILGRRFPDQTLLNIISKLSESYSGHNYHRRCVLVLISAPIVGYLLI